MNRDDVSVLIGELIARKLLIDTRAVLPRSRLVEDLGADSLNILEIVLDINDLLEIEIPVYGLARVRRVEDFATLVNEVLPLSACVAR